RRGEEQAPTPTPRGGRAGGAAARGPRGAGGDPPPPPRGRPPRHNPPPSPPAGAPGWPPRLGNKMAGAAGLFGCTHRGRVPTISTTLLHLRRDPLSPGHVGLANPRGANRGGRQTEPAPAAVPRATRPPSRHPVRPLPLHGTELRSHSAGSCHAGGTTTSQKRGHLMKLSLIVRAAGPGMGKKIPITLSQFLIGRDEQCQ